MSGVGLQNADVLQQLQLEASLVGFGTVHGVKKATLCHKMVMESLKKFLLQEFLNTSYKNSLFEELSAVV